jgi:DNA-binding MarR family transcriptional regulator
METKELASSLRSAISALHKGLRRQTQAANTYSMTEIETIAHLHRSEKLLPTELAALTKVKTQSMSQVLKKMEEEGIVKRTPSKEDKRKVYISLTPSGKKTVEKTRYEKDEWLKNNIEQSLSAKEKELLIKALPVLNKLSQSNKI